MQGIGLTHRGRERSRNEDRFLTLTGPEITLLAVADGMGGHVAGDLAKAKETASHATVSKEQILIWDPEIIFVDISTTRLHSFGPMGLEALTVERFVVRGEGQVRV